MTSETPRLSHFETVLRAYVEQTDIPAPNIKEAIVYSLFPGGKRLRPQLVYLCGELVELSGSCLDAIAIAIELTHCYSLIHDDLPAMDDDDYRRGKLSCHRAFDEATAILCGDGMQTLAMDALVTQLTGVIPDSHIVAIMTQLIKASGPAGMISGQSLDLSELSTPIDEKRLQHIHTLKTGKLISACILMVLAASTVPPDTARALKQFGEHLGLVFQMQDDYLDAYNSASLGKARSSDFINNKTTYATLHNQSELLSLINHHYALANQALEHLGENAGALHSLLDALQQRTASHHV